jgi:hypothetical protein
MRAIERHDITDTMRAFIKANPEWVAAELAAASGAAAS